MKETTENYYIDSDNGEFEVQVTWLIRNETQTRACGDGSESFSEYDFEILEVENLDDGDVYHPEQELAKCGWQIDFDRAEMAGKIQCEAI